MGWCEASGPDSSVKTSPVAGPRGFDRAKKVDGVWVDKGYTGHTVTAAATKAGATVEMVSGPKPGHGFIVQPRRWVVERTNGWINHCRRIDRSQLFDTP